MLELSLLVRFLIPFHLLLAHDPPLKDVHKHVHVLYVRSDFDRVVASSTHESAVVVEAVDEDGLVRHEPIPLIDLNLPIPPIPILIGDNDEVEQVPVLVLAQLAQAITYLACSTARPTLVPVPVPAPMQPPTPSTSL
ncbi:uncharacterized protein EI90DRAFT_3128128 [Cantharellus anzutake]|uniref:uncharacterized protein n=1 Tax=Cantharellus anzutake TaxID=1750568 RepID=UPI001906C34D|nr:uncharacterized protein EI90DRAFT_3128128 [Cantharellus anzutake]KAF8326205.1 hypothetical protein EI90DRAFT_3128128 [Cantharellus anzutake]